MNSTLSKEDIFPKIETDRIIDFFNIRGYVSSDIYHITKSRNLVNGDDVKMKEIQDFVIESHLYDILSLPKPPLQKVYTYDRFEGKNPGFEYINPTIYQKDIKYDIGLLGNIFHNGSGSNRYAIEHIDLLHENKKIFLVSGRSHKSINHPYVKSLQLPIDSNESDILNILRNNNTIGGIVATWGSTNFGDNDDRIMSNEVLEYCKDNNILIHIDMAYGFYYLTDSQKKRLQNNYQYIYSIMTDPHKLICDIGCSLLLFPNGKKEYLKKQQNEGYFNDAGTVAGTSLNPLATHQAYDFLKSYGIGGINAIKEHTLRVSSEIRDIFTSLGYTTYNSNTQYPNICINIGSEKLRNHIIEKLNKGCVSVAKIDNKEYGIRIFVSPTSDFHEDNILLFNKFVERMIVKKEDRLELSEE